MRQYIAGASSVKLHLEADIFASGIIQPNHRIVELRPLRGIKPCDLAPALIQQLGSDLLGQLLFLGCEELIVLPHTERALSIGAVVVAFAHIDRRTAARAFADAFPARIEAVCLGVREERIGFDQPGCHLNDAGEELVCLCLAALNLHQGIFPFRRHGRRSDLLR